MTLFTGPLGKNRRFETEGVGGKRKEEGRKRKGFTPQSREVAK
jgi:hypothetical protein